MLSGEKIAITKKIRKGDKVHVIAGCSKGQSGEVLVYENGRVIIRGVNLKKKAVKPSKRNPKGGFQEIAASIHISNVRPADSEGNPIKVKVQTNDQGDRELYYVKDNERKVWRSIRAMNKE